MEIHFRNIDGKNVAQALVEIPDWVLNHFPIRTTDIDSYVRINHVRNGGFTGIMGNAAIAFTEQPDTLPMPDASVKGVYIADEIGQTISSRDIRDALKKFRETPIKFITTTEGTLNKLGFQNRGPAKWWFPMFGPDSEENWMDFDINTDSLTLLIPKAFRSGYVQGQRKVRFDIKSALDISLI